MTATSGPRPARNGDERPLRGLQPPLRVLSQPCWGSAAAVAAAVAAAAAWLRRAAPGLGERPKAVWDPGQGAQCGGAPFLAAASSSACASRPDSSRTWISLAAFALAGCTPPSAAAARAAALLALSSPAAPSVSYPTCCHAHWQESVTGTWHCGMHMQLGLPYTIRMCKGSAACMPQQTPHLDMIGVGAACKGVRVPQQRSQLHMGASHVPCKVPNYGMQLPSRLHLLAGLNLHALPALHTCCQTLHMRKEALHVCLAKHGHWTGGRACLTRSH